MHRRGQLRECCVPWVAGSCPGCWGQGGRASPRTSGPGMQDPDGRRLESITRTPGASSALTARTGSPPVRAARSRTTGTEGDFAKKADCATAWFRLLRRCRSTAYGNGGGASGGPRPDSAPRIDPSSVTAMWGWNHEADLLLKRHPGGWILDPWLGGASSVLVGVQPAVVVRVLETRSVCLERGRNGSIQDPPASQVIDCPARGERNGRGDARDTDPAPPHGARPPRST